MGPPKWHEVLVKRGDTDLFLQNSKTFQGVVGHPDNRTMGCQTNGSFRRKKWWVHRMVEYR